MCNRRLKLAGGKIHEIQTIQNKSVNILVIPSWYPDNKKSNWAFGQIGGSFFKEQALELNRKVNVQIAMLEYIA